MIETHEKLGGKGMMRRLREMLGGGGMGEMEEMAKNMQAQDPQGILGPNPFPLKNGEKH